MLLEQQIVHWGRTSIVAELKVGAVDALLALVVTTTMLPRA